MKYLTRLWSGIVGEERYELKNHGAQDIRAYDIVKDMRAYDIVKDIASRSEVLRRPTVEQFG